MNRSILWNLVKCSTRIDHRLIWREYRREEDIARADIGEEIDTIGTWTLVTDRSTDDESARLRIASETRVDSYAREE
jgi:hypothetical protein